ncbi:glutaredoxin-like [Pecten maximus]|uniref:glutaredoxin-like n=1 Tax=Pecten maximus TaxID=6579 RepID=UPI0014584637|nr:glutaredoxin-like [Pecten maximus]
MKPPVTAQIYKLQTIFRGVIVQRVQFSSINMSKDDVHPKDIENFIKKHNVVVYSKTTCPFCKKAKAALDSEGIRYEAVEIDQKNYDMQSIQDDLGKLTGARSVPRVFVNGKFIGGGDDTVAKAKNGVLKKLLSETRE